MKGIFLLNNAVWKDSVFSYNDKHMYMCDV